MTGTLSNGINRLHEQNSTQQKGNRLPIKMCETYSLENSPRKIQYKMRTRQLNQIPGKQQRSQNITLQCECCNNRAQKGFATVCLWVRNASIYQQQMRYLQMRCRIWPGCNKLQSFGDHQKEKDKKKGCSSKDEAKLLTFLPRNFYQKYLKSCARAGFVFTCLTSPEVFLTEKSSFDLTEF